MIYKIIYFLRIPFFIPHYIMLLLFDGGVLKEELRSWGKVLMIDEGSEFWNFMFFIINLKEYRSLFYHRLGGKSIFINWYAPGMQNLYFGAHRNNMGPGLIIQHGHSTRFAPIKCGSNCQVWHNVTVAKKYPLSKEIISQPALGDNVKVCTGAVVLGDITIGNNVTIAANTVVTKSVPDNCLVAGNPARIIKQCDKRVDIKL